MFTSFFLLFNSFFVFCSVLLRLTLITIRYKVIDSNHLMIRVTKTVATYSTVLGVCHNCLFDLISDSPNSEGNKLNANDPTTTLRGRDEGHKR